MKLRLELGLHGARKEVTWWGRLEDFPPILNYQGDKWEWLAYQPDSSKHVDWILTYAEVPSYDPNYYVTGTDLETLLGYNGKCDCGAAFTSFPWDHMRFCPKWIPW